jgi:pimeloyl-ACP methyl ester carboxylesterase
LVLIHGLLGFSFSWRHNLEALAAEREVYAVDLLGIGYSDRPRRGIDYGLHATAVRMLEWMEALGLKKVDLLGTSHGGAVAMMMAALAPQQAKNGLVGDPALAPQQAKNGLVGDPALDRERRSDAVGRLVLAAPANPWSHAGGGRIAFFGSGLGRWLAGLAFSRSRKVRRAVRLRALKRMYGDPKKVTAETFDGYSRMMDIPGTIEYALEVVRSWKEDMRELKSRVPLLADVPALLLWGNMDCAVAPASGFELAARMRKARLTVMNGVGHMPYEEAPEEFNRLALDFLDHGEATR